METIRTDALVAGAGPAGLTAACLVARLGVDSLTPTKYGTANAPRAHITNQRTVEGSSATSGSRTGSRLGHYHTTSWASRSSRPRSPVASSRG